VRLKIKDEADRRRIPDTTLMTSQQRLHAHVTPAFRDRRSLSRNVCHNVGMAVRLPILRRGWMTLAWMTVLLGSLLFAIFTIRWRAAADRAARLDVCVASILFVVARVWLFLSWMSGAWAYWCGACGELFQLSERNVRRGYGE
jgi:hypothetical protein